MHRIVIYGQKIKGEECRFCRAAVHYCAKFNFQFDYRDIADPGHRAELLQRLPDVSKVPQIFIADEHIGGFDKLAGLPLATLQQMIGGQ